MNTFFAEGLTKYSSWVFSKSMKNIVYLKYRTNVIEVGDILMYTWMNEPNAYRVVDRAAWHLELERIQ